MRKLPTSAADVSRSEAVLRSAIESYHCEKVTRQAVAG